MRILWVLLLNVKYLTQISPDNTKMGHWSAGSALPSLLSNFMPPRTCDRRRRNRAADPEAGVDGRVAVRDGAVAPLGADADTLVLNGNSIDFVDRVFKCRLKILARELVPVLARVLAPDL